MQKINAIVLIILIYPLPPKNPNKKVFYVQEFKTPNTINSEKTLTITKH